MNKKSAGCGFTMVELAVVVILIGALASFGLAQYSRSNESAKAEIAKSNLGLIATATRMMMIDYNHPVWTGLNLDMSSCPVDGSCDPNSNDACNLLYCNYAPRLSFIQSPYKFIIDGAKGKYDVCGIGVPDYYEACAIRKTCDQFPGQNCTDTNSSYAHWIYTIDKDGAVKGYNGAPN